MISHTRQTILYEPLSTIQCEGLCSMQPTIFLIYSTTTNRRIQGQLNYVYEEERKKKLNHEQDFGATKD